MKIAIMQPYLFPYIGYFQLANAVDEFIVYDNIEFTKKGWINRNRILVNGAPDYITFPLRKDSDYLNVNGRYLADTWKSDQKKILNRIRESYKKAPFFDIAYPLIEKIILLNESNLFLFILNSLEVIFRYFDIITPIIISSKILINHEYRAQKKVIEICRARNADTYLNPFGGKELYNKLDFKKEGIDLYFIRANVNPYKQYNNDFIPSLSIIDLMMFNSRGDIKKMLELYTIE